MAGLRDLIKKRMDAIDKAGETTPEKAPLPQPAATKVSTPPITADEAAKKAARFKWERDNPGVPYKEPLPGKAGGGLIGGVGTGTSDSNLVPLSKGEFVLPADTVKKLGVRNLRDLVDETHTPIPGRPKGMNEGGLYPEDSYVVRNSTQKQFDKVKAENARLLAERNAVNSLRPDMNAISRAQGAGGTIPSGGVEIPKIGAGTVRQAVNTAMPSTSFGGPSAGKVVNVAGKTLAGAGKIAAPIAVGTEAVMTGRDLLDPNVDGTMKAARVAESLGRMGSAYVGAKGGAAIGALGGPAAPITVPAGAIIGGAAGYFAPELLGAGDSMPSDIIDKQRGLRKSEASGKITQAQPSQPAVDPAKLQQDVSLRVANAQAGMYQDQNDRRMAQVGGVAPSPQAKVATQISQGADATQLEAPPGGGYISGVDKDGMRRMVGYTKDTMPAPMGVTDTTSPEVKAADMANRQRWTAEAAAIDKRMEDRAVADRERFQRMGDLNKKNVAEYDRREIAEKLVNRARAYRPEELAGLQNAYKDAGYRVLESTRGLKDLDETQAERSRQKLLADTTKARDEMGLRGQMYQADQKLLGDRMQAEGNIAAANIKARYDAWKDRMAANKDNREAYSKLMESEFQFMDDKGKFQTDPVGAQQFEKWVTTRAMNDKSFLKAMKVNDIDELTATQWRGLVQDYKKEMSLARYAGDATRGPPTRASVRDIRLSDALPSWMNGGEVDNKVGVGETLNAVFNPMTTGTLREQAVQIGFKDGKPIVKAAGSMTPEDVSQAIAFMRELGQNREADELAARYNTTNKAFGR